LPCRYRNGMARDFNNVPTDTERLAEYEAAISAILTTGQSYTIFGSEAVTHADLSRLQMERDRIARRIAGSTRRNYACLEGAL
jgi:hypothetical protein